MNEIIFEKIGGVTSGVPVPRKKNAKYPWREMEVGDSFFVPNTTTAKTHLNGAARAVCIRITIREMDRGVRVWRIE